MSSEESLFQRHKRLLAYLCLAIGGILAVHRLSHVTDQLQDKQTQINKLAVENKDFAVQQANQAKAQDDEKAAQAVLSCQQRNSQALSTRVAIDTTLRTIEGVTNPGARAGLEVIRNKVAESLVATPDRDCDGDGSITAKDYLSDDINADKDGADASVLGTASTTASKAVKFNAVLPSTTTSTTTTTLKDSPQPSPSSTTSTTFLLDPICGLAQQYLELC